MIRTWGWRSTFGSLENRNFRWLWSGGLASSATFQMSGVAQGWLVYELTGSAFALGWVSAGWSISTLVLSLYGGVLCDRLDKRAILLWARFAMILNSLVLGMLISLGIIRVWHIAASSLITGVLFAFLMPAQQSILVDLVDRDTLLNANSLNSVGMGLMGIFAASAAGWLIEELGVAAVYYSTALLYAIALLTLTKLPSVPGDSDGQRSVWRDLWEGVRYIRQNGAILSLLILALSRVLLGMPYRNLMPKYAKDVMGLEATGLGTLLAAPGLGSLIVAVLLASLGNFRGKGRLYILAGTFMGLALAVFSQVRSLPVALLSLGIVGAASNACMVVNQTLMQSYSDDGYRGRVMSVYMMMWGLTPLGTIPAGAVADRLGVSVVLMAQGVLLAASFVLAWLLNKRVRAMH